MFLKALLDNFQAIGFYDRFLTGGTVKFVSKKVLGAIEISVPPLDLQQRFADIVESIEQQKARMRCHLEELDTLFASLQSRAFNGEL